MVKKLEGKATKTKDGEGNEDEGNQGEGTKEVLAAITGLTTGLETMGKGMNSFTQRLEAIEEAQRASAKPNDLDEEDETKSASKIVDLEDLSQTQLTEHILERIEGLLKPISKGLETVSADTGKNAMQVLIDKAVNAHSDFWQYKDQISQVIKEIPNINPDAAYKLAKANNPEKVIEVEAAAKAAGEKAAEEKAEKDAEKVKEDKVVNFGGLTPTSGQTEKNADMSFEDAASAAWTEEFGNVETVG